MSMLETPQGFTREQWGEYVKRGRRIMRTKSASNFELGDLLNEIVDSVSRGHGEVAAVLSLFASQIRSTTSTLSSYRTVAKAWPLEKRREDVPWSVHATLVAQPDRFQLIRKEPSDELDPGGRGQWSKDAALRVRDSVPDTPRTPDERVIQAKRLLRAPGEAARVVRQLAERPDVIEQAVRDPSFRRAVRDAHQQLGERLEMENHRQSAREAPQTEPREGQFPPGPSVELRNTPTAVLRILGQCTSFCVGMQNAVVTVQEEVLTAEHLEAVLDSLKKVRAVCDWCEHAVATGQTGMDEELARLLDGGEEGLS